jgi:hypothetical protein
MYKALLWKLAERFVTGLAVPQISDEMKATLDIGRTAIETCWTGNHEVIKDLSDQFVKRVAEEMIEEVAKVVTSPDPRMANRERLTSCVIELAQFQVLVIDPHPAEDPTGLRGQPGITGELKAHLLELAQKDKGLREFMHAFPTPKSVDDVWNPVLGQYRINYAWTTVYHTLRFAFDDVNHAEGKDWFKPFVAAMCAWQEHEYRELLGMPPAFEGPETEASKKALKMRFFEKFVLEGARFPDLEWRERSEEMVEEKMAETISRLLAERAKAYHKTEFETQKEPRTF